MGGGHFVQNSQFIRYKDIIFSIKFKGLNLFSRTESFFI